MKIILVASAKGGSGRTTTCVRLAQALSAKGLPTGIVDLSPDPTVRFLLGAEDSIPIVAGRAATTMLAARSIAKPYEDRCSCLLVDTSRMDDPQLVPWIQLGSALMVTTRAERNSIRALTGVWDSLGHATKLNPGLKFLGFLPIFVTTAEEPLLRSIRQSVGDHFLPVSIPWDENERLGPEVARPGSQWGALAAHVRKECALQPTITAGTPVEKGLLSRMWRLAANVLSPKAAIVGGKA